MLWTKHSRRALSQTQEMRRNSIASKKLIVMSWALLIAAILTTVALAAGNAWLWSRAGLVTETGISVYQGLSLFERYLFILRAGFLNSVWLLALVGVIIVWLLACGRGASARRFALAISLIFVYCHPIDMKEKAGMRL